jgi:hypothetical protein
LSTDAISDVNTKTSWLEKKGKRRFFVLIEDELRWYETDDWKEAKPKGTLILSDCAVNDAGQVSFIIGSPEGTR